MEILLDTNILLDFFLQRQPFFQEADAIIQAQQANKFVGYVTSTTPVNLYYLARKFQGATKARTAVQSTLGLCRVIPITHSVLYAALLLPIGDYEDAVQISCAMARGLDAIVTRDAKHFKNSPIPVYEPTAFLTHL